MASAHERKWWKETVVYQIYPASFCDGNGDGVGDIQGITAKLDYIASLGVGAIWVCPTYDSPQVDMGYDISNFEDIYPPYGTLQDMETLIKEAHARGLKIMLDLVINHTSDQHAWFKESRSSKNNPKRDWYIWRPARYTPRGERTPPNNWRSCFGGESAWQWDEGTEEYYLHLFAAEQPDLNWENPETRKAIYASAMEFWLQRGIDGFRIDVVNLYSKPPGLPDAPIVDPDSFYQPAGLLYSNGPRIHEFLGEMNAILRKHGAITVGELPNTPEADKVLKYVSAEANQLDMVFEFDIAMVGTGTRHHYDAEPRNFTLPEFKAAVCRTQELLQGTDGWTAVFLENHDFARSISRYADDSAEFRVQSGKMLALMEVCLTGTLYVYQGQEIGAINAPKAGFPLENYLDIDSYQYVDMVKNRYGSDNEKALEKALESLQHFARDHARLPIPWNGSANYGGFSEVSEKSPDDIQEPWMKCHPLAGEINVASQLEDPSSVLSFWRRALRFRLKYKDLLIYGNFAQAKPEDEKLFLFVKTSPETGAKALVVLNFTTTESEWSLPSAELGAEASSWRRIFSTYESETKEEVLSPFEGRVYLRNQ